MKRPAFQFYAADWRGNAKLRRCTHAERGIWIEVMCLMHDSEEYGVLRWPLKDLAQAVNCRLQELRSLVAKDVLKGGDDQINALIYTPRHAGKDGEPVVLMAEQSGPVWYSSRMVRDEYLLKTRGASTRFGSPDHTPTQRQGDTPTQRQGTRQGDGSSSSTSLKPNTSPALPDWLPKEAWISYVEMRKKLRKAPTDRAIELVIAKLLKLKAEGHSPVAVLEQSVRNSWQDVFPLRDKVVSSLVKRAAF